MLYVSKKHLLGEEIHEQTLALSTPHSPFFHRKATPEQQREHLGKLITTLGRAFYCHNCQKIDKGLVPRAHLH